MPLFSSFKQVCKVDDLENTIFCLLRQKSLIQCIEEYSCNRLDFGDLLETYNLLVDEIERLQRLLRVERGK